MIITIFVFFGKTTKKRVSIFYFYKIFNFLFPSDLCFDCFNNRDEKNESLNIIDKNLQTNLESLQVFFFKKKPFLIFFVKIISCLYILQVFFMSKM